MLFRFVLNNIKSKKLRNSLVALSVAVSVMLVMIVYNTGKQINDSFVKGTSQYSVVVGARGSDTQVVLNSLFFYDKPAGNIPYEAFEILKSEYGKNGTKYADAIELIIPLGMGDSLHGFKIVGTTNEYFHDLRLQNGEYLGEFDEQNPQIVLGYNTARVLGLKLGDRVSGAHGDVQDDEENDDIHVHFMYTVVGVLEKTSAPNDDAAFTHIEAVWAVHADHDGEEEGHVHAEGDLTAILIKPAGFMQQQLMLTDEDYLNSKEFKVISANAVLRNVLSLFGSAQSAIQAILIVVIVMAFNMLFLAMFTAANERQKDIAVLRALGSDKTGIFITIILEAVLISFAGIMAGFLASRLGLLIVGGFVAGLFGVHVTPFSFYLGELLIILGAIALSVLATIIPAVSVYRIPPHKYLY